ncbi:MAG TPA: T9SS type A sorting domain-containing protein, partial [Bacteroidia bacterium]
SASNGVLPYTYLWAPGGYTTNSISGLSAGSYTCTVTDSMGCKISNSSIVTDSTTLSASLVNSANVKCHGDNNGLAAFNVTGGIGPHTYLWSPTGGTTTSAAALYAGTYSFTSTDSVGCRSLSIITISQPKVLHDSMTNVRNVACYGGTTGRATAGVTGGTQPYTYLWSTGGTTATLNGVAAGTYSVKVTDSNGCIDSTAITLTQPATAVGDSNHVSTITCYGGTASATVYAFGGVHPYTYSWAPGGNSTNSTTGLTPGTYVVTVRDSNNCRKRDTIIITQPASFIVGSDTMLSYPCNNKAWVQVTGNVSGYTFSWSPSGGTKDTATSLCAGVYVVTITNSSSGCVQHDTITIISASGIPQYVLDKSIDIYPIPARNQINFRVKDNSFDLTAISVFDVTGKEVLTEKANRNASLQTIDVSEFAEGTYFLRLTGKGIKTVKFFVAGK